ncbi:MAG: histidine kinase [Bacillota bacterium]
MAVNKVVCGNKTLIDLSADTVKAENLLSGYTAHKADGEVVKGTLFTNLPDVQEVNIPLVDSDGEIIQDNLDNAIQSETMYKKV